MEGLEFAWSRFLMDFARLIVAFLLAIPIAWEREHSTRIMGLRTFPLVAVASCGYVLVAASLLGENTDAQARIIQGLITGIGFIGGGAILKGGEYVSGTATATSIWLTGAVGAAVAYDYYGIAIALGFINFAVLKVLTPVKRKMGNSEPSSDRDSASERTS